MRQVLKYLHILAYFFVFSVQPVLGADLKEMKFIDHEGQPASFSQWQGSYILLSFVYAHCPMPEMCPLTMSTNKKVHADWLKNGKPFPLRIVMATLDPEGDGPEELKDYGTSNGVNFDDFTFLTGTKNAMAELSSYFNSAPIPGEKLINHKVVTVFLGPQLEILKTFGGNKYSYSTVQKFVKKKATPKNSPVSSQGLDATPEQESSTFKNNIPEAKLTIPNIIDLSRRETLLGINPKTYDKFWERWRLSTVRYRTSPAEQRFIYANDLAWTTLASGGNKFPDGAVLGKVAFTVGFDQRFPSSYQPNQFSRIQLMKKDSKAYKANDGWGYALYLPESSGPKPVFGESEALACHACHKLASNHDFVFSTPAFSGQKHAQLYGSNFSDNFKKTPTSKLSPEILRTLKQNTPLPSDTVLLFELQGFQGTISESMLPVARLASERDQPVVLNTNREGYIVGAKRKVDSSECKKSAIIWVHDISPFSDKSPENQPLTREVVFCDGVFK